MRALPPCLVLLGLSPLASAATLGVGPGQDHATLAEAVAAAASGDVLVLTAGEHAIARTVHIDLPLVISGPGAELVGASEWLLDVEADVRIEDLTFTLGAEPAIVHRAGELVLHGVTAQRGDTPGAPAVVSNGDTRLVVENCTFRDLHSALLPGAAVNASIGADVQITGSTFSASSAPGGGAVAMIGKGSLEVSGSTFDDTHALGEGASGGAILVQGNTTTSVRVVESRFLGTSAAEAGGAIAVDEAGRVELTDDTFAGCSATTGGAVQLAMLAGAPGDHAIERNTFQGNEALEHGGALRYVSGTQPYVHANLWCGNHAGRSGGALAIQTSGVIIENERFVGNTATEDGGALWCDTVTGGPATLVRNNTFAGGSAGERGAHLASEDCSYVVRNVLFLGAAGAHAVDAANLDEAHNAFFDNAIGDIAGGDPHDTSLGVAPLLVAFSDDGDCANDDLRPRFTSPLRDAGDPTYDDPDGTRSDIGAFGGATAPREHFDDDDGDFVINLYDCGPDDPGVFPGGTEICGGGDEDCDGEIDEDDAMNAGTWWPDLDGDRFGDGEPVQACVAPPGTAGRAGDCDDDDPARNPGAAEVCNGVDDDCDGRVDDDDTVSDAPEWPFDADGDGFAGSETIVACAEPEGGLLPTGDCDDADPDVFPGAPDAPGDGIDQDCDGEDGRADRPTEDCGCATGSGAWGLLPLGLAVAATRRRRR